MFIGHYAVALAAKRAAPRTSFPAPIPSSTSGSIPSRSPTA